MTRIIIDLPEGITEDDVPAIRDVIARWAEREMSKQKMDACLTVDEMRRIRAAAISSGTSLQRWSRELGWQFGNAHSALTGRRNGPKADTLRILARKTFL